MTQTSRPDSTPSSETPSAGLRRADSSPARRAAHRADVDQDALPQLADMANAPARRDDTSADRRTLDRRALDRRALDQRVAAVVEQMSDAFIALDASWRITYVNREVARLNGTTPDALVGRDHWAVWPEAVGSEVERQYRRAATERVAVTFAHHYADADVWHDIHAYPADDGGLAIFYRDITPQKRHDVERERLLAAEREARADAERAREQAEAANEAKAQFLAVVSHELRTPLTAIGGYAQLLELGIFGPVAPEQADALGRIQRSQAHVLGLISSVLGYAKLEAGRARFDVADVAVADVVATVAALVEPQARGKGLAFTTEGAEPGGGLVVRADAEKVRQILLNLLSNAIKFTRGGGSVTLSAAAAAERSAVTLCVRDTGRGIAPAQRERVFEPFVQVGRHLSSGDEGVGLGLAISRELARGMGGELSVESELGVGSAFTLVLPRA